MTDSVSDAAPIVNIAAYRFVALDDLPRRRKELRSLCMDLQLMGTVILSPEGINLFLAGTRAAVDTFVDTLHREPKFAELEVKESPSAGQPFHRLLVKVKKEIIAFGVEGIDPTVHTAPKIAPHELKSWLDEGRPVTLLDTRNDYEVKLGTFRNALTLDIDHFREFPDKVRELPPVLRDEPIVMFCTGGIRCEKAGPFMQQAGFTNILQLDGGILKYFEECGGEHWEGECFVFDHRVAVAPSLEETPTRQCFACQQPLTLADQQSEFYVEGKYCPRCFRTPEQRMQSVIDRRQAEIVRVTSPLPGSIPRDNLRPLNVPERLDSHTLLDFLDELHPHYGRANWLQVIEEARILDFAKSSVNSEQVVRAGERLFHLERESVEPSVNTDIRILYEDDAIVVVNKPAPLPVHPSGRFHRNTLTAILNEVYRPEKLRPAHRLDANTTGALVLSRSRAFAAKLQPQFERQEVEKSYLVRVQGVPGERDFRCETAIGRQAEKAGGRLPDPQGLPALTDFVLLRTFPNGDSLLEAKPLTGRTNQIRLHLWELGLPVCGDPVYLPGRRIGEVQTSEVDAPAMCLHAQRIAFTHPLTGQKIMFEAPPPAWAT